MSEKPTPMQIVRGGEHVETIAGSVFVRQVKPVELLDYLQAESQSEESVLRMTCSIDGNPVDLAAITCDDYEALIKADARQNFTHARNREQREAARANRQMEALKAQSPEVYAQVEKQQAELIKSMLSSLGPLPQAVEAGASAQTE